MKSAVGDEGLKDKISESDKKKILDKCNEVLSWLEANQLAEKDEFDHKRKELENMCNPIITKLYQSGCTGPTCTPGYTPGRAATGPTIEEVD